MKLELKHLSPYLPYGLKARIKVFGDNETISCIEGLNEFEVELSGIRKTVTEFFDYENIEPILHPLSDLTKEIEVNGERFVPIEKVQDWNTSIDFAKEFEALLEDERWLSTTSYLLVELLFEWHFDVFGLIEKGLAIDIYTLEL